MERITKDYEELKRREENKTTEKFQTRSLPEDAAKIQVGIK